MSLAWSCLLVVMAMVLHIVTSTPSGRWLYPTDPVQTDCDQEYDILKICQTCAVRTKSNVVYPMCCLNKEEVRGWCQRYLSFGIGKDERK